MFSSEKWPAFSLHVSIKHFMCAPLGVKELVRNMGQRC